MANRARNRIGANRAKAAVFALAAALLCAAGLAGAADGADPAASLRARYVALQAQLGQNAFGRPLHLESSEAPGMVRGDIYAIINSPFEVARAVLGAPDEWCDIMMLHINTKNCRIGGSSGTALALWIGAKAEQPLEEAHRVDFGFGVRARTPGYLQVRLAADEGPMGTRDYRIELEAVPLEDGRSFIHLGYAYGYGTFGRLAMQTYLATIGRNKVGFSLAGTQADEPPRHIAGLRGVVERNTMRYYLAIEAYLGAMSARPQARLEKRLRDWHAATERYPRQLHEMDAEEYLDMKRKEILRQRAAAG